MSYHVYRATDGRAEWPIITQYQLPPDATEGRSVEVELLASCRTFLVAWEVAHAFIPAPGSALESASRGPAPSSFPGARRKGDIEV